MDIIIGYLLAPLPQRHLVGVNINNNRRARVRRVYTGIWVRDGRIQRNAQGNYVRLGRLYKIKYRY